MDLYTAYPESVEPLPFHSMTSYPYRADEQYPETEKTTEYRRRYNTRIVKAAATIEAGIGRRLAPTAVM